MTCNCKKLPDFAYYKPGRSLSRHLRPYLKMVGRYDDRELFRCLECGTYWRIDRQTFATERFAWKLSEYREDWGKVSKETEEKNLLLASRQVMADESCIWAGCGKMRLQGSVYCVDHIYDMGVRK